MQNVTDGKQSSLLKPLALKGNISFTDLENADITKRMKKALQDAPAGSCVCWGIPFEVKDPVLIKDRAVSVTFDRFKAPWLVFMHTSDFRWYKSNSSEFIQSYRRVGLLGEREADYVIQYSDGEEERVAIKRRHQINLDLGRVISIKRQPLIDEMRSSAGPYTG